MKITCKLLLAFTVLCACATAQQTTQLFYTGGGLLQYSCAAPAQVAVTSIKIRDSSLTNISVSSNVGTVTTASPHGLWVGASVTVAGSTTALLNGVYSINTVPSTTTYTIATTGVGDATYATSNISIATTVPLLTSAVWSITVLVYNGSGVLQNTHLAGPGVSQGYQAICANRANYN